jgi:hypothetical protein
MAALMLVDLLLLGAAGLILYRLMPSLADAVAACAEAGDCQAGSAERSGFHDRHGGLLRVSL